MAWDKNILQFELWTQCNNNCKFCYLPHDLRHNVSTELKLKGVRDALATISDENIFTEGEHPYTGIGLIGGEFFQGQLNTPELEQEFSQLFRKIIDLRNRNVIDELWCTATLTKGTPTLLHQFLSEFKDLSGIWILTSYDLDGRFHTPRMFETWDRNVKQLKELFPQVGITITIILSGFVLREYEKNPMFFRDLKSKYQANLFFKYPSPPIQWRDRGSTPENRRCKQETEKIYAGFIPTRAEFLRFFRQFKNQEPKDMWDRLFNINLRADDLVRYCDTEDSSPTTFHRHKSLEVNDQPSANNSLPCGHAWTYQCYLDSDRCILCDKEMIGKLGD